MGTVTGVMVTGMIGMPIMITGMIGATIIGDGDHHNDWAYGRGHGNHDDWDDRGPRFAYGRGYGSGWYPGYGAYAAPRYDYPPNQCFDPRYGWYPCPYYNYGY